MIDSHCHLDHEPLFSDLTNVIQRSKDVGIKKLLTISTSFKSFHARKQKLVWKLSVREKWKNGKQAKNIMAAKYKLFFRFVWKVCYVW